jgi:hypothetical protein
MPAGNPQGYGSVKAGYNSAMAQALMKNNVQKNVAASRATRRARDANAMGHVRRSANAAMSDALMRVGPISPTGSGGGTPPGTNAPPPTNPRSSGGGMGGKGLRNMSSRTKLMMGAGALVLGAAAYSGRRGDGTSSGRSGMTRY